MTIIVFFAILSVLIMVHEWGHYITARRCGVKVEQFALGFGPKLFGWKRGDTEFMLCAIPLGGFVKMAGDERSSLKGDSEEFFSKSIGQRALVVVMGPVVNFALAFLCFWAVFTIGFVDLESSSNQVGTTVGQVLDNSPAAKAGLKSSDTIVAVNGQAVEHWPDIQKQIVESKDLSISMVIKQQGVEKNITVIPQVQTQKDIFGRVHQVRRIGVGPLPLTKADDVVIKRYGIFGSFFKAGEELVKISVKTYVALYEMVTGMRSPKEAMGIVGMFFVIKFALTVGISFLLYIVGVISASLAIFNLLPIIPLDGGHLLLLLVEKIRGRMLSLKTEAFVSKFGFSLMMLLALFVFYVDIERIGIIDKVKALF